MDSELTSYFAITKIYKKIFGENSILPNNHWLLKKSRFYKI